MECEYVSMSMEGKSEDSRVRGVRDLIRIRGCSTVRLKSRMKMEKLFGVMGVWVNRRFEIDVHITNFGVRSCLEHTGQ